MAARVFTCSVCGEDFASPPDEFRCRLGYLLANAITAPGQRAVKEALDGGADVAAALEAAEAVRPDPFVLSARLNRALELRDFHPAGSLTAERAWTMAEAEMN